MDTDFFSNIVEVHHAVGHFFFLKDVLRHEEQVYVEGNPIKLHRTIQPP